MICQRCNAPFAYLVDSQTLLHLVKSEDDLDDGFSASGQGDGEDDEDDDGEEGQGFAPDQPEKVVGSHHFDLLAQIEDELILSVPYVPKHDVCPARRPMTAMLPKSPLSSVRRRLRCWNN